uniref:non-specific serine/threonine protein kinase n=1 Tax=Opuntia streptacantha TaxID=393608 RepID=A0A7C9CID1_OPUST
MGIASSACLVEGYKHFAECCNDSFWGQMFLRGCNLMFSIDPIFDESALPPTDSRSLEDPTLTGDGRPEDLPKNSSVRVSGIRTSSWVVIICSALVGELVLLGCLWLCLNERRKKKERPHGQGGEIGGDQVVQYDFASLKAATNYFSTDNKLGEGGFGVVYKGKFGDGQEVAIKRYSRNSSTQAINDFKVEAHLLGRLQHRNLVKLLGFCIQGEELLFVYEFMPNTSLDRFLFDPERRASMNWERRCKIIDGIARGLLYLHEDSRQKIIHRDLKASNILLDQEMGPKIADFGIAKPVETRQTHGDASRVVGTWGYMAPEYVTSGQFSVKSDVFSFGVIVLEIISGLKSFCSAGESHYQFLYLHAWKLWNEGNILDIIDPMLLRGNSSGCRESEVMRSIHVALLCVQQDPTSRPTMASIIRMLTSAAEALPSLSAVVTPDVTTTMSVRKYDLRSQAGNLEAQNNSNDMSHSTSEEQITELLPR